MEHVNPPQSKVKEIEVVSGLKVVQTEYAVKVPVFVEYELKQPVFVAEEIKIPSGWDKVINALALEICEKVLGHLKPMVVEKVDEAIKGRIDTIKHPKIVEELNVIKKDVYIDNPIFNDVKIDRPTFVDKEIVNPVLKNVEVVNAVILDKAVINSVIEDKVVTNAIIKDVDVERAIIREKVVDVIHPRYLDLQGNPTN